MRKSQSELTVSANESCAAPSIDRRDASDARGRRSPASPSSSVATHSSVRPLRAREAPREAGWHGQPRIHSAPATGSPTEMPSASRIRRGGQSARARLGRRASMQPTMPLAMQTVRDPASARSPRQQTRNRRSAPIGFGFELSLATCYRVGMVVRLVSIAPNSVPTLTRSSVSRCSLDWRKDAWMSDPRIAEPRAIVRLRGHSRFLRPR